MSSVHLSVRLSVTLVDQDHIGWKSWKLTARTVIPTPSLFVAQRPPTYSQGNMRKFWETKNLIKKTLTSLTLVRLCEETWETLISRGHLCDSTAFLLFISFDNFCLINFGVVVFKREVGKCFVSHWIESWRRTCYTRRRLQRERDIPAHDGRTPLTHLFRRSSAFGSTNRVVIGLQGWACWNRLNEAREWAS